MELLTLPGTDLRVSRLCAGGVSWGTALRGEEMDRLLNAFRQAGGNFFDTAHCYSFWLPGGTATSELALADYLRRQGGRSGVVVATKGGHSSLKGYRIVDRHLSPARVAADLDDSLARLDTETIDLYWLHRDDPREPAGEVIETLNAEVRRGRVRYLAASNWTAERITQANAYARAHGLQGFVAMQPEWSLAQPNPQPRAGTGLHFFSQADRDWCARENMAVIPYTPTAGGYFASSGQSGRHGFENPTSRARLARVEQLARELGRSANQIALAYLMSHPFPVMPIVGTTKLDHLADAVAATECQLTAAQLAWLHGG